MTFATNTHRLTLSILIGLLFCLSFIGCNDDNFSSNPKYKLSFSKDTLSFDTVFSTIGSTTSRLLIYNKGNANIRISNMYLAGGKNSAFHINVDGSTSPDNRFSDIEISKQDSMYLFVSVTVNPNQTNNPVLITDSIVCNTNGNTQKIILMAYGQDVIILKDKKIYNDTTLTADKPYLIYGNLTVDSAKTLTLAAGTRMYFHSNANLIVYGNLIAQGTTEQPILLRGDRMDKVDYSNPIPYNYIAGQWGGVYLLWKAAAHSLNHVIMNSGTVGIYFANSDRNYSLPTLSIENSKIHNFENYGVVVKNGDATIINSEISNTGSFTLYLNGGKHTCIQSTIANYYSGGWQPSSRDGQPAVMLMDLNHAAPMTSTFKNCVISGSISNEFSIASEYLSQYNGVFDHCYIRKSEKSTLSQFSNIHWYNAKDTLFSSTSYTPATGKYYNFCPDSVSPARGLADPAIVSQYKLTYDLNGKLRDSNPDAGAYEWVSRKK